jgi:dolichol-phosphate mannosyltransferase
MPTLNEVKTAPHLIREILSLNLDVTILVVDDDSSDGTVDQIVCENPADVNSKLFFLVRSQKLGLSRAYKDGFAWGRERKFDFFIEMDADGSHQVSDLDLMIKYVLDNPDTDLLIGSRWIRGGNIRNWSRYRKILSRTANQLAKKLLGIKVSDSTSGFRVISRNLLEQICPERLVSIGYSFQIEVVKIAFSKDSKIREFPITFIEREFGQSKINLNIIFEALSLLAIWSLERFKPKFTSMFRKLK